MTVLMPQWLGALILRAYLLEPTFSGTVAQIESVLGHTPDKIALYNVRIQGPITGYVQHLNWNSVDNLFSDLSGFRSGALTSSP